jgi:hypothetical protein
MSFSKVQNKRNLPSLRAKAVSAFVAKKRISHENTKAQALHKNWLHKSLSWDLLTPLIIFKDVIRTI